MSVSRCTRCAAPTLTRFFFSDGGAAAGGYGGQQGGYGGGFAGQGPPKNCYVSLIVLPLERRIAS